MDILTYGILNKKVEEAKNISGEKITEAVNTYLDENPPAAGATAEQAAQIDKNVADIGELKGDLVELSEKTFALNTDNLIDMSKLSEKGVWYYNGIKYTTGNDYTNCIKSCKLNVLPNTKYYFGTYKKDTLKEYPENSSAAYLSIMDENDICISNDLSGVMEYEMPSNASYVYISYKLYENKDDSEISIYPYCGLKPKPIDYCFYEEMTMVNVKEKFDNLTNDTNKRSVMYIMKEDNDTQLLIKMKEAFDKGNVDVIFEKATYTLSEAYDYIRNTLGENWTIGLPVGKGCRYFFNDSTIISNPPADNYSDSRNILDCQAMGSDYEIYDVTLINNGGRYCIHDEGNSSKIPYCHKYENVVMIYNKTELTHDTGCKAFGCGTGFDASISFDGCVFIHNGQEATRIAVHSATSNPDSSPCKLHFIMKNCYIDVGSIWINQSETPTSAEAGNFVKDVDTLDCFLFGNSFGSEFNNISANVIENNNTIRTN